MSAVAQPLPLSPPALYESSADPLLTPSVTVMLDGFMTLVWKVAQEERAPLERVQVSGIPASDEIPGRLLITAQVALPAVGALAYWDKVGGAIEKWASGLDAGSALIVLDRISLDVEWSEDAIV